MEFGAVEGNWTKKNQKEVTVNDGEFIFSYFLWEFFTAKRVTLYCICRANRKTLGEKILKRMSVICDGGKFLLHPDVYRQSAPKGMPLSFTAWAKAVRQEYFKVYIKKDI